MNRFFARGLAALLLLAPLLGLAAEDGFLDPEKAFRFGARAADATQVEITFEIAPGYYMYREQFRFSAEGASLGSPQLPEGKVKYDETFRKNVETYRGTLKFALPVTQAQGPFKLRVVSQGCSDRGLCYPPMPSVATVSLAGFGGDGSVRGIASGEAARDGGTEAGAAASRSAGMALNTASATDLGTVERALQSGAFWTVVAVFFGAGVLLSLTPCVLPMLPILSSIIIGEAGAAATRRRGLLMASSYSLGMALVYTALGVAAGLAGEGLAAALQTPWVLGAFALLLVVFSLSMFGVYELRLPSAVSDRLAGASQRLSGGRIGAVFAMGGLSALIVSPCVAAPLAGAMVYLSQTRDVLLGGTALFFLAAGMSVPLLLLGASAGTLLPKAGPWMETVKRCFGLLLLGVALWMVQPLLPAALAMMGWGGLLAAAAALLLAGWASAGAARRTAGLVVGALAVLELVGAASGGYDPLQPLAHFAKGREATESHVVFTPVRSVAELDAAVARAGKPVMLDFYADWCVSCKEMERFTFTDPQVQSLLAGFVLLKADVTQNNADDRALLRRFKLFGPPGTIFFDAQGREHAGLRVIGFQSADRFADTLRRAAAASAP